MKLVKGPEAERVTGGLWRQFLISEIAGGIMLGEVQDICMWKIWTLKAGPRIKS